MIAEGLGFHHVLLCDAVIDEGARSRGCGMSPALRRYRDVLHAGIDVRLRVGTLDTARRRAGVNIFAADVDETGVGEGKPDIALDEEILTVALVELAIAGDQQSAFAIAAQTEIENAGDRIRSIERRRAVTQNLQLADRDRRNRRKIGPLRS